MIFNTWKIVSKLKDSFNVNSLLQDVISVNGESAVDERQNTVAS